MTTVEATIRGAMRFVLPMLVASVAYADLTPSASTDIVFPAEGNVRCSDYFANDVIREANTSNLSCSGADCTVDVIGPANPIDDTGQSGEIVTVTPTFSGGEPVALAFSSSTPINATIVKKSRTVNVYVYQNGGVSEDSGISLNVSDPGADPLEISSVSFCYGVSATEEPPAPPPSLPFCSEGEIGGDNMGGDNEDECEGAESFECDVTDGKIECCACDGKTIDICDLFPDGEATQCGFNLNQVESVLIIEGSTTICRQTSRGYRCYTAR